MTNRFHYWYVALALIFVTLLARGPYTYLSPIADLVATEFNLSQSEKGVLLSLPTFVLGVFSVFAAKANSKYGVVWVMFISLVLLALGIAVREYFSLYAYGAALYVIYLGTIVLTIGIAFISVLYPAFINAFFRDRVGLMSAITTANLVISAVSGTALGLSLTGSFGWTWREVGTLWFVAVLAVLFYYLPVFWFTRQRMNQLMFETKLLTQQAQKRKLARKLARRRLLQMRKNRAAQPAVRQAQNSVTAVQKQKVLTKLLRKPVGGTPMWQQPLAWWLSIMVGLESANYYFVLSWYPVYAKGFLTADQLSVIVNMFQLVGIPSTFMVPIFMQKFPRFSQPFVVWGSAAFAAATAASFFFNNFAMAFFLFFISGVEAGVLLGAFYSMIALKTTRPEVTGRLAAFGNAVGYLITAIYLLGFGVLIDLADGEFWLAIIVTVAYNILIPVSTYLTYKVELKD